MKQICALMTLFAGAAILHASPPTRLRHAIQNSGTFVLAGHGRLLLERAQDLGEVDSSLLLPQLEVHFAMSPAGRGPEYAFGIAARPEQQVVSQVAHAREVRRTLRSERRRSKQGETVAGDFGLHECAGIAQPDVCTHVGHGGRCEAGV